MTTFMKGKTPEQIVSTSPINGDGFDEAVFADAYESYGGFPVCICSPENRDALLKRLNAYEQIAKFALELENADIPTLSRI
jgi:hypothetical protein